MRKEREIEEIRYLVMGLSSTNNTHADFKSESGDARTGERSCEGGEDKRCGDSVDDGVSWTTIKDYFLLSFPSAYPRFTVWFKFRGSEHILKGIGFVRLNCSKEGLQLGLLQWVTQNRILRNYARYAFRFIPARDRESERVRSLNVTAIAAEWYNFTNATTTLAKWIRDRRWGSTLFPSKRQT